MLQVWRTMISSWELCCPPINEKLPPPSSVPCFCWPVPWQWLCWYQLNRQLCLLLPAPGWTGKPCPCEGGEVRSWHTASCHWKPGSLATAPTHLHLGGHSKYSQFLAKKEKKNHQNQTTTTKQPGPHNISVAVTDEICGLELK